jgi:UBX domain-containing protein 11
MGTEVYQENGVHKFRKADPLPIGFFSNGIAIKGFRFFPYKSKESLQILGDLVDGYFPFVFKGKYPNGVFMKVVDKVA